MFGVLTDQVKNLFSKYSREELEQWHLSEAHDKHPDGFIVNLPQWLPKVDSDTYDEWRAKKLKRLLTQLPTQQSLCVYGVGPAWLYAALALHAKTQPFYQFDARIGWVEPPLLIAGTLQPEKQSILSIVQSCPDDDSYLIELYPKDGYLDYSEANQLVFPEPPSQRGVIVSGKLPLWLFTALVRFYTQWDVPWIAVNDARNNKPVVVYSQVTTHPLGKQFSMPER